MCIYICSRGEVGEGIMIGLGRWGPQMDDNHQADDDRWNVVGSTISQYTTSSSCLVYDFGKLEV